MTESGTEGTSPAKDPPRRITRRALLADAALAAGAGAGIGIGIANWTGSSGSRGSTGDGAVEFYGGRQAGIETPPPSRLVLTAFDIESSARRGLRSLMQAWTAAAARLTSALPADGADSGEVAGLGPSGLTLTFGVGPGVFDDRFGLASRRPPGLAELPPFPGEALEAGMTGGDLVLQACAQDQQVAYHAVRQLARIGAGVVRPRWQQVGFLPATPTGSTPRNLLGFKDGTINPALGSLAFDQAVWVGHGGWRDGTYMCVRRIRIDLAQWDAQTVADQQVVIGRVKASGAPLSGGSERTPLNLSALGPDGVPAIPMDSHVRLAAPQTNHGASILRRGYNYDDGVDPSTGAADAGTIFIAFVADIESQFVPVQTRLASSDRLNSFTTAVGSATFAVLPGVSRGDYLGSSVFA